MIRNRADGRGRCRATPLLATTMTLGLAAQDPAGVWLPGFDHAVDPASGRATDYLAPFRDLEGFDLGGSQIVVPAPYNRIFEQPGQPGGLYGWAWSEAPGNFNAIHMCLIPKGPYRGRVLVWNRYPVLLRPGAPLDAENYWACQGWAVVDPDPEAPEPRIRNFLLPLQPVGPTPPSLAPQQLADIFCSGHAWSPFGDLVVAGGAQFSYSFPALPPPLPPLPLPVVTENGAKFLFLFDPARPSSPFPGRATPLYDGEFGAWRRGPDLTDDRYYPSVTMTHRLQRLPPGEETAWISGGTDITFLDGGGTNPDAAPDDPRNTFESFVVRASDRRPPRPFLQRDPLLVQLGLEYFRGPGVTSSPEVDWLLEYPRLHLLGDGTIFRSGYAPPGARLDPEQPATEFGQWDTSVGAAGSTWPFERSGGASLFFARYAGFEDLVVRLCGHGAKGVTDTAEFCQASLPAAQWRSMGRVPQEGGAGRDHVNALILPDGSMLVIGGDDPGHGAVMQTALYKQGTWSRLASSPTRRRYHATAVLLPDGRVFVGGGEGRHDPAGPASAHDYDTFEPPYLQAHTPRPTGVQLRHVARDAEGTYLLAVQQHGIQLAAELAGLAFVDKVVIMAPGATTHHSDMSARYVELASTAQGPDVRTFDLPGERVLPRGYYMLFAVSDGGVPAEAIWVRVR